MRSKKNTAGLRPAEEKLLDDNRHLIIAMLVYPNELLSKSTEVRNRSENFFELRVDDNDALKNFRKVEDTIYKLRQDLILFANKTLNLQMDYSDIDNGLAIHLDKHQEILNDFIRKNKKSLLALIKRTDHYPANDLRTVYLLPFNERLEEAFIQLEETRDTLIANTPHSPRDREELDKKLSSIEMYKAILRDPDFCSESSSYYPIYNLRSETCKMVRESLDENSPFRSVKNLQIDALIEKLWMTRKLIGKIQGEVAKSMQKYSQQHHENEAPKKSSALKKLGVLPSPSIDRNPLELQIAQQQLNFAIKLIENVKPHVTLPMSNELDILAKHLCRYYQFAYDCHHEGKSKVTQQLLSNFTLLVSRLLELDQERAEAHNPKANTDQEKTTKGLFEEATKLAAGENAKLEDYSDRLEGILQRMNYAQRGQEPKR